MTPGKDAAIADGYKDLCFTNNQETPIYIWGNADGSKVSFIIFGKETRPENRSIDFEVEKLYEKSYEGGNSPELDVALWKIVKVDGVETERIKMHTDHYEPSIPDSSGDS